MKILVKKSDSITTRLESTGEYQTLLVNVVCIVTDDGIVRTYVISPRTEDMAIVNPMSPEYIAMSVNVGCDFVNDLHSEEDWAVWLDDVVDRFECSDFSIWGAMSSAHTHRPYLASVSSEVCAVGSLLCLDGNLHVVGLKDNTLVQGLPFAPTIPGVKYEVPIDIDMSTRVADTAHRKSSSQQPLTIAESGKEPLEADMRMDMYAKFETLMPTVVIIKIVVEVSNDGYGWLKTKLRLQISRRISISEPPRFTGSLRQFDSECKVVFGDITNDSTFRDSVVQEVTAIITRDNYPSYLEHVESVRSRGNVGGIITNLLKAITDCQIRDGALIECDTDSIVKFLSMSEQIDLINHILDACDQAKVDLKKLGEKDD